MIVFWSFIRIFVYIIVFIFSIKACDLTQILINFLKLVWILIDREIDNVSSQGFSRAFLWPTALATILITSTTVFLLVFPRLIVDFFNLLRGWRLRSCFWLVGSGIFHFNILITWLNIFDRLPTARNTLIYLSKHIKRVKTGLGLAIHIFF